MNCSSSLVTTRVVPPAADTQHGPPRVATAAEAANSSSSTNAATITTPRLTINNDDKKKTLSTKEDCPPIDLGSWSQVAGHQLKAGYHSQEEPARAPHSPPTIEALEASMHRPTGEPQSADPAERSAAAAEDLIVDMNHKKKDESAVVMLTESVLGGDRHREVGDRLEVGHGFAPFPDNPKDPPRSERGISSPSHSAHELRSAMAFSSDVAAEPAVAPPFSVPQAPVPAPAVTISASQLLLSPVQPPAPPPSAAAAQPPSSAGTKKRPRPFAAAGAGASTPSKKNRRGPTGGNAPAGPSDGSPLSTTSSSSLPLTAGRWTAEEHRAFLSGLATYGREWKRVALHIPTRTSSQVRSHAQKYFTKLQQLQSQQQQQQQHTNMSSSGVLEFRGEASTYLDPTSLSAAALTSANFGQGMDPNAALHPSSVLEPSTNETLTPSVRANVERILAQPESVQAEVDDTLQRLRERYRHLQHRLRQRQLQHRQQQQALRMRGDGNGAGDEHDQASVHSNMSLEVESVCNSLQDSELIALHVLQGGLEHQSTAPSASSTSSSPSHDTSTLTNTVVHSQSGANNAHADAPGDSGPTQGTEAEEKVQQSQQLQEPETSEEEVRPNPQDPPSAANPYP